jgi:hypothetical protein
MRRALCTISVAVVLATRLLAQTPVTAAEEAPSIPQPQPRGAPAVDARLQRPGPWDNDVLVFRVTAAGEVNQIATFARAGVPTIARLVDGRLIAAHQHFPADFGPDFDKVAVRFSSEECRTWSPAQVITLDGLPEGMRFPFDPTLVPLPDGGVRLYFTSVRTRRPDAPPPGIYSARSEDGVHYGFESDSRFAVLERPVIDCAVVLHRGVFHLFAPDNGVDLRLAPRGGTERAGIGYHGTSKDGLHFERVADVKLDGRWRWLGNAQSDGTKITFYGTEDGLGIAESEDGVTWKRLASIPPIRGGDPGAVTARDGGLIVVITGPPRPGTASDRRHRAQ